MKRSLKSIIFVIFLCYYMPVASQLIITEKEMSDSVTYTFTTWEQLADSVMLNDSLANYYDQIGNHMLALKYASKNVAINSIYGKTTTPYAVSILKLARYVYPSERDYDKELSYEGLSILKDSLGAKSSTYTKYLLEYAWRQFNYGLYQEACSVLKEAAEVKYNGDEFYLGFLYYSYAHFLSRIDDNDNATLYAKKAESFFIEKEMWADDYYPQTLIDLALLCAPDIEESEVYLTKAKDVIERYKGKESIDYLNVILDFSYAYKAVNQLDKTLEYAQQAKDVGERIRKIDNSSYIYTLEYLAKIYSNLNKYSEALSYAENCLSLLKEDKELSIEDRLPTLDSLVVYCKNLFNTGGNISYLEKVNMYAKESCLIRKNLHISGLEMEKNLFYLLHSNFDLRKYEECEENVKDLKEMYGDAFSSKYKHYYDDMGILMKSYFERKKYKESLNISKELYTNYVQQFGEDGEYLPSLIKYQASIYANIGDYDNFQNSAINALELYKNLFGQNSIKYLNELSSIASVFYKAGFVEKSHDMYKTGANLALAIYGKNHQLFISNYLNAMLFWHYDRTPFIDDYNLEDFYHYHAFLNILYGINNNVVNYQVAMGGLNKTVLAAIPNVLLKYENDSTAYKAIYNSILFHMSNIEELKSNILKELGNNSILYNALCNNNIEYLKYHMKSDPVIVDSLYNKSLQYIDQLSKESSSFKQFYEGKINVDKIRSNLLDNEIVVDYIPLKRYGEIYNDYLIVLDKKRECPDFIPVSNASEQINQICSAYDTSYIFIDNDSLLYCLNLDFSKSHYIVGYDLSVDYLINRGHKESYQTPAHQTFNQNHLDAFASAYNEFERGVNLYNKKQYEDAMSAFYQCDSLIFVAKGEKSNYFGHGKQWIASCLHKLDRDSIARMYSQYYYLQPVDMRQTILSDSILDLADKLYDDGLKKEALEKYHEASQIEKSKVGKNSYWYANTISHCAEICNEIGDHERAIGFETEAIEIRKDSPGIDHIDYYWSLNNLFHSYSETGNEDKMMKYGELKVVFMEEHKEIVGKELLFYPIETSMLGISYVDKNNEKAYSYIKKSIESADILQDFPTVYMNIYYKAILGLKSMDKDSLSFELCKKIIPYYENNQIDNINPNEYFDILLAIANHYVEQGDYITTSVYQEKALEKVRDKSTLLYGTGLSNLALTYCELGRLEESIKIAEEAVLLTDTTQFMTEYAKRLLVLARCYNVSNNPKEALRYGKKSYGILKERCGLDNGDTMVAANNLAMYYNELGYHEEFRKLLYLIIEHAEKDSERNGETLGTVYNNLAMDWNRKDFDMQESLNLISKSYEIRKKKFGEKDLRTIESLYNRGRCLLEIGDISEGTISITKALDQTKGIIGSNNLHYIEMMEILPLIYGRGGDLSRAIEIEEERSILLEKIVGDHNISYLRSLDNLSELYFYTDDTIKMRNTIIDESVKYQNMIISDFPNYTSVERENMVNDIGRFYDWLFPIICYYKGRPELYSALYNALLLRKGLLLNSDIEFSRIIKESGDSTLVRHYNQLIANKNLLGKQYQLPENQRIFNIDSLKHTINEEEDFLVVASKEYGNYTQKLKTKWTDIKKKLNDDELSVEFVSFNDTCSIPNKIYYALVIDKHSESPALVPLCTETQIQSLIKEGNTVGGLYKLIWDPILRGRNNVNVFFFSPSGILNNIGIEYIDIDEHENISDKYALFRLSSTREIIEKKETTCRSAALYGGLDYSVDTNTLLAQNEKSRIEGFSSVMYRGLSDSLSVRNSFEPLYNTKTEISEISKTLAKGDVDVSMFSETSGTEESFKALSGKGTNLIHLATHGMYIGASEAESKKRDKNLSFIQIEDNDRGLIQEDKSLTRSFLVMSGGDMLPSHKEIPENLEDGILTASEISKLDLRGLDLVVLSACQTALGDIDSEGVYGLQRGFKKAGAKTILMSLDKVDDEATRILMVEFYRNLMSGKTKHQSLKDAQKHLKEVEKGKYNKPEYWASFIMLDGLN